MGELPNSHGRTLTDKSYVMHGILSGTYLRAVPTFCEWKKLHLNQRPAFLLLWEFMTRIESINMPIFSSASIKD
jgi:hypothetical protein